MGKKSAKPTSVASQRAKSDQKERKRSSYSSGDIVAELQRWNLRIAQVKDDGNCFFRAAADQLEGASGDHMALRQKVVTFIRSHVDDFEPYMEDGETLDRYCKRMSEVTSSSCISSHTQENHTIISAHHSQLANLLGPGRDLGRVSGAGCASSAMQCCNPGLPGWTAGLDHQARVPRLPAGAHLYTPSLLSS